MESIVDICEPGKATPEKRHCVECGAVLRTSNPTALCAPRSPESAIEIPDWAIALIEHDSSAYAIVAVANILAKRTRRDNTQARNHMIRRCYAEGGISQSQLAEAYGLSRPGIDYILGAKQKGGKHHEL